MEHVPDHHKHWRNSGKGTISYREEEKGKGRDGERGKERTVGRMTGWERHSLHSFPGEKVGKVRVQVLGPGGHTFMLTEQCLQREVVT